MTPEQLKASILQYAIQGKLVEQRPEEGTAEELYHSFIKTQITESEEVPFDIPDNWLWMYLEDISVKEIRRGKSPKYDDNGSMFAFAQKCNTKYDGIQLNLARKISDVSLSRYADGDEIQNQDIIINSTGTGTLGRIGFYEDKVNSLGAKYYPDSHVTVVRLVKEVLPQYVYICLTHYHKYLEQMGEGSTKQKELKPATIKKLFIPLPPLAEQHRIVAKIEEMLPLVGRYAASYEELEKLNAKFPEDMKKSILQYAIQGKLVEQRPEEGTAEELYRQIQAQKQQLMKEGKIKKEKPLPEITEAEIPFDIPESWKWVRVGGLFNHNTGKAMNSSAKKIAKEGSIRKFITTSNVYWNRLDLTNVKEMFFSNDELERCTVTKGDLLMCEGGAYFGRTAIWDFDYDICFQNHVHRLRGYKELDLMYFYYVFYFYRNTNMMKSKGTAMPGLSSVTLHEMVVPLPPLAEQKRIVQKINQLLPYCQQLTK